MLIIIPFPRDLGVDDVISVAVVMFIWLFIALLALAVGAVWGLCRLPGWVARELAAARLREVSASGG